MEAPINKRNTGVAFEHGRIANISVWAPGKSNVEIEIPAKKLKLNLNPVEKGCWMLQTDEFTPGDRYQFIINNEKSYPDPASLSQPEGVHGFSEAVDTNFFEWNDHNWKNHSLSDYIIYELHTGTFSNEGTFQGIIDKLQYLQNLGINAIEVMPVAQFPGSRNWGYDGVYPFAVQNSYGGYKAFQQLVDICHNKGIAVILDVVYNHLGPEGNYLGNYGSYFTDKYKTPWGLAVNFDDAGCDNVRKYFIENALMWLRDFHVDALRLDAVHAIKDFGARHFLAELSEKVAELEKHTGQEYYLIAESDLNDPKYIRSRKNHGYGMDAQWIDEFHHALRVTTGEKPIGYYSDFKGLKHLAKVYSDAYVYDGIYSEYRDKTFGASATSQPGEKFIVFSQNHDQVGNRMLGERTAHLLSFEMQKLVAGAVILSPYTPLLFMGEEWSCLNPFLYFVSHSDPKLIEAVGKGRKEEFKDFHEQGEAPDPQNETTFYESKLQWDVLKQEPHSTMLEYYKELIALRKKYRYLLGRDSSILKVHCDEKNEIICLHFKKNDAQLVICMNFSSSIRNLSFPLNLQKSFVAFNSAEPFWKDDHKIPKEPKDIQKLNLPPQSIIIITNDYV